MTPDPTTIAALYDEKAPEYDEHYKRRIDLAEDEVLYGWAREFVDGKRVLDVGCGTGELFGHTSPRHYVGLDISKAMLDRAAAKFAPLEIQHRAYSEDGFNSYVLPDRGTFTLLRGTLEQRSSELYQLGAYDAVTCLWAFPHFPHLTTALIRMRRLAKPGGFLFLQGFAERYAQRPNYILNGHGAELLQPTTPDSLADMCVASGWEPLEVVGFRYLLDQEWLNRLPTPWLAQGMRSSSKLLPASRAATHIVVARAA